MGIEQISNKTSQMSDSHDRHLSVVGARYLESGETEFVVWAPKAERVELRLLPEGRSAEVRPAEGRLTPLKAEGNGYFRALLSEVKPGTRYKFRLNGEMERPDPASRFQPEGVHGPSEVVDPAFSWTDSSWTGVPLENYVIYELHVGTFTPEGTFEAIISHLEELKNLGITALELLPVAQFPGRRNWGYDGAYPFAVQNSYGGPQGLRKLVDACHAAGLAVIQDVVYNHLGPEGNYLADYGPYFTDRYKTPWGSAVNFDGPGSDEVRRFFFQNAAMWVREFHMDALRVDALHAVMDASARPFLAELVETIHDEAKASGRKIYAIAESNLNDTRVLRPRELGGFEFDAQWNDDFHHSLRALLTGDRTGYYQDFGELKDLAKALEEGFVYSGQISAFRGCRHGESSRHVAAGKFVVFSQNHDQIGNRMRGERLGALVPFEAQKLAAGLVLTSPFLPLLFMGEEYGETAPFQYFVDHGDPALVEAVRRGRREEFERFHWPGEPPDPQDEATFQRCKLNRRLVGEPWHAALLDYYRILIGFRRNVPALRNLSKDHTHVTADEGTKILYIRRWWQSSEVFLAANISDQERACQPPIGEGKWAKRLDSSEERWRGTGSEIPATLNAAPKTEISLAPWHFVVFEKRSD